jgi:hypothetical protein
VDTSTTTSTPSPVVEALHLLRIGGGANRDDLAAATGAPVVDALVANELVKAVGTRVALTPTGRQAHEAALAAELDEHRARPAVEDGYQRFLPLNDDVLQLCTDWQVRLDGGALVPNDHADPAYDAAVIDRLATVGDGAAEVVGDLAAALPRFGAYGADLADAVGRVGAGDTDYLTNPRVRSFHTVWFELHEDLLATLGIDRVAEAGADPGGAVR